MPATRATSRSAPVAGAANTTARRAGAASPIRSCASPVSRKRWRRRRLATRGPDTPSPGAAVGAARTWAWLLALTDFVVMQVAIASSKEGFSLTVLCVAMLLGAGVAALFGLGQGAAAIRVRGRHLLLASSGLVLSGLYVGALIGVLTHTFW